MKVNWSILAVCQEAESREKTSEFCDELVRRFWDRYEISVIWFTQDEVRDPQQRQRLHEAAQQADLVVFGACTKPISGDVFAALENCLLTRDRKEGLFAGIVSQNSRNQLLLRSLAHLAGMDFISEVPLCLEDTLPDSPESCTSRAQQVSHLLSDILDKPPPIPERML